MVLSITQLITFMRDPNNKRIKSKEIQPIESEWFEQILSFLCKRSISASFFQNAFTADFFLFRITVYVRHTENHCSMVLLNQMYNNLFKYQILCVHTAQWFSEAVEIMQQYYTWIKLNFKWTQFAVCQRKSHELHILQASEHNSKFQRHLHVPSQCHAMNYNIQNIIRRLS